MSAATTTRPHDARWAEGLARDVVERAREERAAWAAAGLADPFARPLVESAWRRTRIHLDEAWLAFFEGCEALVAREMGDFARALAESTRRSVAVCQDLAAAALLEGGPR